MAVAKGSMPGFRDMLADQMIPREEALDIIKSVYETYGFVPLKTPALERYETLTGKYGEEGQKLIYQFHDNGNRHVAMRYDQTVPLARVVAQHGSRLPSPYKRYAVGEVWRGESPGTARFREFTQFDADTVGSNSYMADTEIIAMMADSMEALGVDAKIRVNDRRLLDGLADMCGISAEAGFKKLVGIIDKIDKIGKSALLTEVTSEFDSSTAETVSKYISVSGNSQQMLKEMSGMLTSESATEGIESLEKILGALTLAGYTEDQVIFDPTIARGLDYYTSTIYETMLTDLPEIGSVCSGGRFDKLIESMGGPDLPAVGTSIGVDRLLEGLRELGKLPDIKTNTKIFIANMDEDLQSERFALAQRLRESGIATEMVLSELRLGKQFKNIEKLGVDLVAIYGTTEHEDGVVAIKSLKTGEQTSVPTRDLVEYIKSVNDPNVEHDD